MADCKHCRWLIVEDDQPHCRLNRTRNMRGDVRACMIAILHKHLPQMTGRVMEIGFGINRISRRMIRKRHRGRTLWHGVDPRFSRYLSPEKFPGSAANIPFPDEYFDWVLAFETIEHWREYGETPQAGIDESYRVLRPGGRLLITAPIHLHGDRMFLFGRLHTIRRLFRSRAWSHVEMEFWRRNSDPLPPIMQPTMDGASQEIAARMLRRRFGHVPPFWRLEILAVK